MLKNKKVKKCVIFDMDGIIIDSEPIHQKCERKMFEMLGINISEEEHNALVGATDSFMWNCFENKYNLPIKVPDIIQLKKTLYLEYLKKEAHIKPIPYVSELIVNLYKNKYSLALASSSPHEQIDYILSSFELKRYFHSIISGEEVQYGKPHPEMFLRASRSVGVSTNECVVIEDSYNGVMAAKAAEMKCIGFKNLNSGIQDLSRADMIISSFRELTVKSVDSLIL